MIMVMGMTVTMMVTIIQLLGILHLFLILLLMTSKGNTYVINILSLY